MASSIAAADSQFYDHTQRGMAAADSFVQLVDLARERTR